MDWWADLVNPKCNVRMELINVSKKCSYTVFLFLYDWFSWHLYSNYCYNWRINCITILIIMRVPLYNLSLLDSYAHLIGMLSWFSRYDKFGFSTRNNPNLVEKRPETLREKNKTVLNNVFRRQLTSKFAPI